jgi:hypothetical protein
MNMKLGLTFCYLLSFRADLLEKSMALRRQGIADSVIQWLVIRILIWSVVIEFMYRSSDK